MLITIGAPRLKCSRKSLVKLNAMSPNHLRFPALIVGYMYSLRDPIGSFEFVRAL